MAIQVFKRLETQGFSAWFGPMVTLVPVPKSSLMKAATLWVPQRLARAMANAGLAAESVNLLQRTQAVPKAALRTRIAERPTAKDHYGSLSADGSLVHPEEIVLVDDVVTTGATMLAAASRLGEAFPQARIRGFAALRAISNPDQFTKLFDPCVGTISLLATGRTRRVP